MLRCSQVAFTDVQHSRLDNNEVIHMKAGDVCVQRGTIHGWTNPHDKPARMYFVLTGKSRYSHVSHIRSPSSASKPIEIDGKRLDNAGFKHEEVASGGK